MAGPRPDAGISNAQRGTGGKTVNKRGTTQADRGLAEVPPPSATASTSTTARPEEWEPVYTPGIAHNHKPSGKWKEIQHRPVTTMFSVDQVCRRYEPAEVANKAKEHELKKHPLAVAHFGHYLTGKGKDFIEDEHLTRMLQSDLGVRRAITGRIGNLSVPPGMPVSGRLKLDQSNYENEEFLYSFGAIDHLDYEVDVAAGLVRVWFQDRYEWHPVYVGLYERYDGDVIRGDNCFHAAMVELKLSGAADFWMKGKAIVPLDLFKVSPEKPRPRRKL